MVMEKTRKEIEMTDDYSLFHKIQGNRMVDESHVQRLMRAMKVNDLFTPIMVNSSFEVIDGQHRLEARKRLGLIVPYFVMGDYGLAEVQAINSQQKKWSIQDYTDSYIALGLKDYEIYKWFMKRYRLPHTISVGLLSGASQSQRRDFTKMFNEGQLRVKELEYAKQVAEKLEQVAPFFSGYNDRGFVLAMIALFEKKVFDFKKFLSRLESNPLLLKRCATTAQYIDNIEDVYNYRSQNKVSLKYAE